MGVPGFFASLYSKYKNTKFVFSKSDLNLSEKNIQLTQLDYDINSIDELFLDTNCLIHPVCFRIFNENQSLNITNPLKLENKMIKEVILYIEEIICYIKPSTLVYIAIDGVAPMAKIKHQRLRRFKSIADSEIKESIAAKHHVEYTRSWNNSAITPGTEFMEKLTCAIINYLNIKKIANKTNINKVKYIYSSANTPGEGEHKILQYIKEHINENKARVIYGLDADLLYLSLASRAQRIYLLREITEFQNIKSSDAFCFVSIDMMKECLFQNIIEDLDSNTLEEIVAFPNLELYKDNFIQDYIFMGFLLGNDFLPGLPSVNLMIMGKKLSGLDILLRSYKESFSTINSDKKTNYTFIIDTNCQDGIKIKISYEFLKELFTHLNGEEEMYFRERSKYKRFIRPCEHTDAYSIEIYRMENLMFKVPDLFELGKEGIELQVSKERYYKHYYGIIDKDTSNNNVYNNVKIAIAEYFKGLYWNAYYYFDKCIDYKFYYKNHKCPFVSDIFEWLLGNKENFDSLESFYPRSTDYYKLIHPIQQLFMVIPIQSSFLLPLEYKQIMLQKNMEEYFPRKITQDFQLITKYWQGLPEIEIIEPYAAWEKIRNIKLTNKEENRNKFKKIYEIFI